MLKVWVDGHGRRPGSYFLGSTQHGIHCGQLILKLVKFCHEMSDFKANTLNLISAGVPPQTRLEGA